MAEDQFTEIPDDVLILKVPHSDLSRFDTSGRLKELGKTAEPRKNAGMNPVKRFVVSTVGVFALMMGFIGLSGGQNNLISIVCMLFGLLIIWTFIGLPEMKKRRAAPSPADKKDPEVSMAFSRNYIVMRSPFHEMKKEWSELTQYKKTKKGVRLTFSDAAEAYLPLDVFYGDELKTLTALLQNKKII